MIKAIKIFLIIGLFGIMISCSSTDILTNTASTIENQTTENLTTNSEITTEIPNTTEVQTTNNTTTEAPTTIEPTTETPTTIESTTETPTTNISTTTEVTTLNYVTIYFEKMIDGSSGIISSEGISGNPFEMPDDPTKNFYVFEGWFLEESFETPFYITEFPDEDITVYAKWTRMTKISFDTITIFLYGTPGESINMPNDPTKYGFIFDGWYIDQDYTTPFIQNIFPESDITLYAKWVKEVTMIDEMTQILEENFDFICVDNVCNLEESSYMTYTFDLNTVTFTKELLNDETTGDDQTKTETVVIHDNWDVEYNISITYLSTNTASMRVTGNGTTGSYSVRSFSSNYLSENNMYDDAIQFIDGDYGAGAIGFLEYILEVADITLNDLIN